MLWAWRQRSRAVFSEIAPLSKLTLISFPTCPYVQRAVIALKEKGVDFDVVYIDLANKPDWFLAISPLGKVPVLKVEREGREPAIVFESAVIIEYLEETVTTKRLHPEDALERAQHRSWIEFGSQVLGDIWRLTNAKESAELAAARQALTAKLQRLETVIAGPLFAGTELSLVDAVFAPAFRQLDALDSQVATGLTAELPKVSAWRAALAQRQSVKDAAPADFVDLYLARLRNNDALILKAAA
jgi:glutathione S-transferase